MLNEKILRDGLRIGDICTIIPPQGKRKDIILNRKKIEIICQGNEVGWDYHQLCLPSFTKKSSRWILELVDVGKEQRYKMISLDDDFHHNGLPIERGWPLRNSKVKLEYNFLNFRKENESPVPRPLINQALVQSDLPILLQGETGTGKTTLARDIHRDSGRIGKFVHISLKSFNAQLIESELFGHVKGAFTGAIKDKMGAVTQANLGTLFLDEIDSVDLTIQSKLLLFLDNFSFRKVGAEKDERADIRLIVASAAPLLPQVEKGSFRKDLYYRIASSGLVHLMPLREDKKKLQYLLDSFLSKNNISIDFNLRKFYLDFLWPGNIRQLISHLEYKKVTSLDSNLIFDDADKYLEKNNSFLSPSEDGHLVTLDDMKKKYVDWALKYMDGNITQTALALEISKNTLKKMINHQQSYGY